ncbi:hypothetical protein EHS25_003784 [Saitozyma podzolica]|uniref:Uncharacterized protein n=1 Tax=Saitozyma podzolica TaxID=1890683 RepID=A0A427Y3I9_9TREE|nr:hypothetical protein EHS25_003784 [Saitozyma podzolica]
MSESISEPISESAGSSNSGDQRASSILRADIGEFIDLWAKLVEFTDLLQSHDPACPAMLEDLKIRLAIHEEKLQCEHELPSSPELASEMQTMYTEYQMLIARAKTALPDQLPEGFVQDHQDPSRDPTERSTTG